MYQKEVDEAELASAGMTKEDAAVTVEIWHENSLAFNVFSSLSTQWRYSMNGVSGLDYNVIPTVLRMMKVARDDWHQLFDDIRIMESAALTEINKKDK